RRVVALEQLAELARDARPAEARIACELGELLQCDDASAPRARRLLADALDVAEAIGMDALAQRVRAALDKPEPA
ncbi:MAG: hypothetical protein DCC71_23530, partial [Proteobacteria bacterium]